VPQGLSQKKERAISDAIGIIRKHIEIINIIPALGCQCKSGVKCNGRARESAMLQPTKSEYFVYFVLSAFRKPLSIRIISLARERLMG
jgi:hypothetical protein